MRMILSGLFLLWMTAFSALAANAQSGKLDVAYLCGIDGSCVYTPLIAQRYEVVVASECGAWHDQLKADNPNIMTFVYTSGTDNYTQPTSPDGGWYFGARKHAWLRLRCQELGYSPEILYIHYYDNTVVSGVSIPGTYSSTLTDADSVSRTPVYLGYYQGSGIGRILINFSHPITRQLLIEYAKKAWTDPNAGHDWPQTSSWDGFYLDNWLANELHPGMGQIGSITSGGQLVEHPTHATNGSPEVVAWFQNLMHQYARQLRDTLHNAAAWAPDGRPKYLAANIANTWLDDFFDPSVAGLDYLVQEFQYNPVRSMAYDIPHAYRRDSACAVNGVYPMYCGLQTTEPSSGEGTLTQGEALYGNLAWYYTSRSANTYMFQMHNAPSNYWIDEGAVGWDTLSWRGCMDFDVGTALDRYSTYATGNDPTGQAYTIFQREYSNARVFVRPRVQWNHDITPQTAVTVTLPTPYRKLEIDGTLGPLSTTFSIMNGCGLILAKADGGQTWISPPTPLSPYNGEQIQSLQPTFTVANAYDPEGRSLRYEFQLDGDGDFAGSDLIVSSAGDVFSPNPSTMAWNILQQLADGSLYRWRCRAVTTSGDPETSDWSAVFTFSISLSPANTCPTPPTASSPSNGAQVSDPTPSLVVLNSSDGEGDPLNYEFVVATDAGFSAVVASTTGRPQGAESTAWSVSLALTSDRTYYWRARAFDGQCYGAWSTAFSLTISGTNSCPTTPTASTPVNGSQIVNQTPQLVVVNSSDADGDPLTYEFVVATDAGFSAVAASTTGRPQGSGSTSWTVNPELSSGQTYYWHARAYDGQCYGAWSAVYSFSIAGANSCPTLPTASTPANGAQIADRTPQLVVLNSSDADGDALTYEFEVSVYSTFNIITTSTTGRPQSAGSTSWTVTPELTIGLSYYWRARAYDDQCYGPWSVARLFQVSGINQTPGVPTGIFPINSDTVTHSDLRLTVRNVTDPENDEIWYQYFLYEDGQGIEVVDNIPEGSGSTTSWQPDAKLTKNKTYTWRVQCHDPISYSGPSPYYPFYLTNISPTTPEAYSPMDGERVFTKYVELTVENAEDPDSRVLTYDFQVGTDADFAELVDEAVGVPAGRDFTSWTTVFIPEDNVTYWWRARAVDEIEAGPWSAPWAFVNSWMTVAVEGIVPELLTPAAGSTVKTLRPQFEVRVPPGALGEKCEFGIASSTRFDEMLIYSGEINVESGTVTWTPEEDLVPESMYYWQARLVGGEWSQTASFVARPEVHFAPNPYSISAGGSVTIYYLPVGAEVRIYTVSGKPVATLINNHQAPLVWNVKNERGEPLAPGVYLYMMQSSDLKVEGKFAVAP